MSADASYDPKIIDYVINVVFCVTFAGLSIKEEQKKKGSIIWNI